MRSKILTLLTLMVIAAIPSVAQLQGLRHGQLDNGFTYYVYGSSDYQGQVNFFLLQNIGAVVEKDDQRGLAHFIEHMAFDATKHYPDGIMKFLRENNIDVFNATTGLDETKYYLYNIPTDDRAKVDHAFRIMRDWSDGLLIRPKDVEKERGIIIEEWRQRYDVNSRISDHLAQVIYPGTPYATRNIIGSTEVLKAFKPKDLQRFYTDWYRPDLQCLMIVGDIDPVAYEQMIHQHFSSIKPRKNAPARPIPTITPHTGVVFSEFVDPENSSDSFGFYQTVHTPSKDSSRDLVMDQYATMMFNDLIVRRIAQLSHSGAEEFVAMTATYSPLIRSYSQAAWDVVPYKGRELQALRQMLQLRETIRRDGFTAEEFAPIQEAIYADLKSLLDAEQIGTPDNIMEVYRQHYLYNQPITSFREGLRRGAEKVLEMEVDDLNEWIRGWMTDDNLAFVTFAKADNAIGLSEPTLREAMAYAKQAPSLKLQQPKPILQLIDYDIQQGQIVDTKEIEGLEAEEWYLSNGARVLFKAIPELKGQVFFAASATGGKSIVEPDDLPSYKAMQDLILQSGVYHHDRNSLAAWTASKDFRLDIQLTDYMDNIGGMAPKSEIEDMLKYTYLIFTHQNFDPVQFRKYQQKQKYLIEYQMSTPLAVVQDSIRTLLFPTTKANPRMDTHFIDQMKIDELPRLYNDKFGNAARFTFCIAGDISSEEAKMLTQQYIAALPGIPGTRPTPFKVLDATAPEREITHSFTADTESNIGQVEISYQKDITLTPNEQKTLNLIRNVLEYRLFTELREKQAATYGVGVNISYTPIPVAYTQLTIHFETERDKVDTLREKTYEVIQELLTGTLSTEDFNNARIPLAVAETAEEKTRPQDQTDNDEINPLVWIAMLNVYMEQGKLPEAQDTTEMISYKDLTIQDVQKLMQKITLDAKKRDISIKSRPQTPESRIH